ncbi:hypothetical protein CYY_008242, partial [Polysphondylium violaceum]
ETATNNIIDEKEKVNQFQLNLLFGSNSNSKECKFINSIVEFGYKGGIYIGLITKTLNNEKEFEVDTIVESSTPIKTEKLIIPYRNITGLWKSQFGQSNINELINLESEFRSNEFDEKIKLKIFNFESEMSKNGKTKHYSTSFEASKILFKIDTPKKRQVYSTYKYLKSRQDVINPEREDYIGYKIVFSTQKTITKFIEKSKSLINNSQLSPLSVFDEKDLYLLNLIVIASITPHNEFFSFKDLRDLKFIFGELNYKQVDNTTSLDLLEKLNFLSIGGGVGEGQKIGSLQTKESLIEANDIIDYPHKYPDYFKNRVDFKLEAIAIDPGKTIGVDDAFSIDLESDKDNDILYCHIADLNRWIHSSKTLYKQTMFNLKSWYLSLGVSHMLPIPLLNYCSLSNASTSTPAHAITVKMMFDKQTHKMVNYEIFPTRITNLTPLSEQSASQYIKEAKQMPRDKQSQGHKILSDAYQFTLNRSKYRENNLEDVQLFNRSNFKQNLRVFKGKNEEQSTIYVSKSSVNPGTEIVSEVLCSVDDTLSHFFDKHQAYAFYRSYNRILYFQKLKKKTDPVAVTSPLRSFMNIVSQIQLGSILCDNKPMFGWSDISNIGSIILKSQEIKQKFQEKLSIHFIFKMIEFYLLKQGDIDFKTSDSITKAVLPKEFIFSKTTLKESNLIDENSFLVGRVVNIRPEQGHFNIYFPQFKYSFPSKFLNSNNNNNNNSNKGTISYVNSDFGFQVNDYVVVSIEKFDVPNQILDLRFKMLFEKSISDEILSQSFEKSYK